MNNDGKITCSKCGKKVPWDQSYPGFLCYDCAKGLKKPNEGKKKDSKEKKSTLGVKILKFLLLIASIGIIIFWLKACVGNFMNVDENPAPTIIHWKSDK